MLFSVVESGSSSSPGSNNYGKMLNRLNRTAAGPIKCERIHNTDLNTVLSRCLNYIVERGIVAGEIALANLLVERR